jgi:hypothetical protein
MDCHIYRKVLLMVSELHKMGYQRIRIAPAMSPSGCHWRCAVTPVQNISNRNGAMIANSPPNPDLIARYTSGSKNAYFGWMDYDDEPPAHLADIFIRGHRALVEAGWGQDLEYANWYQSMLELTDPDLFPIAYADYDLPTDYLMTTSPVSESREIKVPMPPLGLAEDERIWSIT